MLAGVSNATKNLLLVIMTVIVIAGAGYVLTHNTHQASNPPIASVPAASVPGQTAAPGSSLPSSTTPAAAAPGAAAIAHLRSIAATRKPVVTFLGSSLTAGCCTTDFGHTWPYLVQQRLQATVGALTVTRHVYPGSSLPEIVSKGGPAATVADKPDLVVFETSGTNDCGQQVPEAASDKALAATLRTLRGGLPDAVIVVQTSSPKTDATPCADGHSYEQFMAHQSQVLAKTPGILFFDLYAAMAAKVGRNLTPYMHDMTHPNDAGAAVWAGLLENYLGLA